MSLIHGCWCCWCWCRVVAVRGAPGIGKTEMLKKLMWLMDVRRCINSYAAIAYVRMQSGVPLIHAIAEALRFTAMVGPSLVLDLVANMLRDGRWLVRVCVRARALAPRL